MNPIYQLWLRNALIIVVLIVVFGGVALVLNYGLDFARSKTGSVQGNQADIRQLVDSLLENIANKSDETLVREVKINNRISISEQLLELELDKSTKELAIRSKLCALISRETIAHQDTDSSTKEPERLFKFAEEHLEHENQNIANPAKVALATAAMSLWIDNQSGTDSRIYKEDALNRFQSVASENSDNPVTASILFDWLMIIRSTKGNKENEEFVRAFEKHFDDSGKRPIMELVEKVRGSMVVDELKFVDVVSEIVSNRDSTVEKLLIQIDSALERDNVSEFSIGRILERIDDLVEIGAIREAQNVQRKLSEQRSAINSDPMKERLDTLKSRLFSYERPMDFSGLTDRDGLPVKSKSTDSEFRILLFASSETRESSRKLFQEIIGIAVSKIEESAVELSLIFVHEGNSTNDVKELKDLASMEKMFNIWFLQSNSTTGKKFIEKYPVAKTPNLVILDRSGRVRSVNPSIEVLEYLLYQVKD